MEGDQGDTMCSELLNHHILVLLYIESVMELQCAPMCEGTDARQKFKLYVKEFPNSLSSAG